MGFVHFLILTTKLYQFHTEFVTNSQTIPVQLCLGTGNKSGHLGSHVFWSCCCIIGTFKNVLIKGTCNHLDYLAYSSQLWHNMSLRFCSCMYSSLREILLHMSCSVLLQWKGQSIWRPGRLAGVSLPVSETDAKGL